MSKSNLEELIYSLFETKNLISEIDKTNKIKGIESLDPEDYPENVKDEGLVQVNTLDDVHDLLGYDLNKVNLEDLMKVDEENLKKEVSDYLALIKYNNETSKIDLEDTERLLKEFEDEYQGIDRNYDVRASQRVNTKENQDEKLKNLQEDKNSLVLLHFIDDDYSGGLKKDGKRPDSWGNLEKKSVMFWAFCPRGKKDNQRDNNYDKDKLVSFNSDFEKNLRSFMRNKGFSENLQRKVKSERKYINLATGKEDYENLGKEIDFNNSDIVYDSVGNIDKDNSKITYKKEKISKTKIIGFDYILIYSTVLKELDQTLNYGRGVSQELIDYMGKKVRDSEVSEEDIYAKSAHEFFLGSFDMKDGTYSVDDDTEEIYKLTNNLYSYRRDIWDKYFDKNEIISNFSNNLEEYFGLTEVRNLQDIIVGNLDIEIKKKEFKIDLNSSIMNLPKMMSLISLKNRNIDMFKNTPSIRAFINEFVEAFKDNLGYKKNEEIEAKLFNNARINYFIGNEDADKSVADVLGVGFDKLKKELLLNIKLIKELTLAYCLFYFIGDLKSKESEATSDLEKSVDDLNDLFDDDADDSFDDSLDDSLDGSLDDSFDSSPEDSIFAPLKDEEIDDKNESLELSINLLLNEASRTFKKRKTNYVSKLRSDAAFRQSFLNSVLSKLGIIFLSKASYARYTIKSISNFETRTDIDNDNIMALLARTISNPAFSSGFINTLEKMNYGITVDESQGRKIAKQLGFKISDIPLHYNIRQYIKGLLLGFKNETDHIVSEIVHQAEKGRVKTVRKYIKKLNRIMPTFKTPSDSLRTSLYIWSEYAAANVKKKNNPEMTKEFIRVNQRYEIISEILQEVKKHQISEYRKFLAACAQVREYCNSVGKPFDPELIPAYIQDADPRGLGDFGISFDEVYEIVVSFILIGYANYSRRENPFKDKHAKTVDTYFSLKDIEEIVKKGEDVSYIEANQICSILFKGLNEFKNTMSRIKHRKEIDDKISDFTEKESVKNKTIYDLRVDPNNPEGDRYFSDKIVTKSGETVETVPLSRKYIKDKYEKYSTDRVQSTNPGQDPTSRLMRPTVDQINQGRKTRRRK